jgi:hypothetical protein
LSELSAGIKIAEKQFICYNERLTVRSPLYSLERLARRLGNTRPGAAVQIGNRALSDGILYYPLSGLNLIERRVVFAIISILAVALDSDRRTQVATDFPVRRLGLSQTNRALILNRAASISGKESAVLNAEHSDNDRGD